MLALYGGQILGGCQQALCPGQQEQGELAVRRIKKPLSKSYFRVVLDIFYSRVFLFLCFARAGGWGICVFLCNTLFLLEILQYNVGLMISMDNPD